MQAKSKIALIGCRNVAPASAYSLLNGPIDVEIVLIGEFADTLLESVSAFIDQWPARSGSTIRVGETADIRDSEICVLSSGVPPVEGDTEVSFLSRNVEIVRQKGELLRENGFQGVLVVTTHPAEIMAQVAMESSGLSSDAVVGIGPHSVSGFVVGADRRLPVATWCSAAGCDVEYVDSCDPDCPYFEDMLERFHSYERSAKRDQTVTVANCVMRICEAILGDEKAILPVAAFLNGEHAITGTFTNVPCVIGRRGIEKVLELPLSDAERKELLDTARENGRLFYQLTKKAIAVSNGKGT